MRRRITFTPGDIFEFSCAKGLCYGQYLMNKPGRVYQGGVAGIQILRIIDRCWQQRPADLAEIAMAPTLYYHQGQTALELRDKTVIFIGNAPIPENERGIPVFRTGLPDRGNDGKMLRGALIIGEEREIVEQFGPEHYPLSGDSIEQIALTKKKIERGWRPELDSSVVGIGNSVMRDPVEPVLSPSGSRTRTHYLYFKSRPKAETFIADARAMGHEVKLERAEESKSWLVFVIEGEMSPKLDSDLADVLIKLANLHGGTYDGSETEPL